MYTTCPRQGHSQELEKGGGSSLLSSVLATPLHVHTKYVVCFGCTYTLYIHTYGGFLVGTGRVLTKKVLPSLEQLTG